MKVIFMENWYNGEMEKISFVYICMITPRHLPWQPATSLFSQSVTRILEVAGKQEKTRKSLHKYYFLKL